MIDFENLGEFTRRLENEIIDIEREFSRDYRIFVLLSIRKLAEYSPQWSGNFAANWSASINSQSYFKYEMFDATTGALTSFDAANIQFRGDIPAIEEAVRRNESYLSTLDLTDIVYIDNLTPYGDEIAENRREGTEATFLRPGNYINPMPYPLGAFFAYHNVGF